MNKVKRFFKELKRVKWPTPKESGKTWLTTVVFVSIVALILFALATVLLLMWKKIGIGV